MSVEKLQPQAQANLVPRILLIYPGTTLPSVLDTAPPENDQADVCITLPIHETRNYDLVLPEQQFTQYFSDLTNRRKVLEGIDQIWRSGNLFSRNGQDTEFFKGYIDVLSGIVNANTEYFSGFTYPWAVRNGTKSTSFDKEFKRLVTKDGTNSLTKALILTQLVELGLLGINPTRVLTRINQNGGVHANGFINEILASWFLAKFVYKINPDEGPSRFHLSVELPAYKKHSGKQGEGPFLKLITREIDIVNCNALGSVKSTEHTFSTQARDLFFTVTADNTGALQTRTRKLLLLKTADSAYQFSPDYPGSHEHNEIRRETIIDARKSIREVKLSADDSALLTRLVSEEGIDIYFLPPVNNNTGIRNWIEQNYQHLDEQ